MRYPASEKLEIIRIVEQPHLCARKTLEQIGVPRTTLYRWYDRYLTGGLEALVGRLAWSRASSGPLPDKTVLLPYASLVLGPYLDPLAVSGMRKTRFQRCREVFLAAITSAFCPG